MKKDQFTSFLAKRYIYYLKTKKRIEKKKQVYICKFSYIKVMIYKFFEQKVTNYIFSVQKDAQNIFY